MSENPTASRREARRKTVGEVVTVWRFPPVRSREKADYNFTIIMRPPLDRMPDTLHQLVVDVP